MSINDRDSILGEMRRARGKDKNFVVLWEMERFGKPITIKEVAKLSGLPYVVAKNAVMRLKHYQRIKLVRRYPSEYVVRGV